MKVTKPRGEQFYSIRFRFKGLGLLAAGCGGALQERCAQEERRQRKRPQEGADSLRGRAQQNRLAVARGEIGPDLVVVDVLMPGMTGIQMLERARARSEWVVIPFLVISAADMSEVSTAPLGGVTFLHKPFDDRTLLEAVEAAL